MRTCASYCRVIGSSPGIIENSPGVTKDPPGVLEDWSGIIKVSTVITEDLLVSLKTTLTRSEKPSKEMANSSSNGNDGNAARSVSEQIFRPLISQSKMEDIPELENLVDEDNAKDMTEANVRFIRFLQSRFEEIGNSRTSSAVSSFDSDLRQGTTSVIGYQSRNTIPFMRPSERREPLVPREERSTFIPLGGEKIFSPLGKISLKKPAFPSGRNRLQATKTVQTEPMVENEHQPWLIRAKNSADHLCVELTNYINSLIHSPKNPEAEVGAVGGKTGTMDSEGKVTSYEEVSKLGTELSEKMKSILVLAECLRNSIPIPMNYEDCTSEGLEISDNNEKTIYRKTYKEDGLRSKKTLSTSSTQTDCAEVVVANNTETISKRSNRNSNSSEGKKPAPSRVPDKPPRKSIVSLPPDRKPPQKSKRSLPEPSRKPVFLPITSISSSKTSLPPSTKPPRKSEGSCPVTSTSSSKVTSPLETKPPWKSAASLPVASTSSCKTKSIPPRSKPPRKSLAPAPVATSNPSNKIEKSKIPDDKSRLVNKRTQGKWQNKLKDGVTNTGAPPNRQKQAPRMDPKKLVASKTDQASSCFVQAEPENVTAPLEEKQRLGRILKRRNAVLSKTGHRLREKTNEPQWR
ncbi:hypothetical protein TNIN_312321 [Trichonephila inaurata madagascariensis]|uniref:Uncharacterized protein n=1 Tax=Trichonephila inaurata madagascariensis TaxID=2747483 RepID=A0A8X6MCD3_9ARAC|nr:hypothetical protein TNIN_312321 [Trichonephila inaurata madagascariensis]